MQSLVLCCLAQRPHLASLLQLLAIWLKPQQLKHCVTRNVVLCLATRQWSPPRKRPQSNSAFATSSDYTPIISNNLTFSPVWTLPGLFHASLSTVSPAIVEFYFVMSSIVCLASRPQMASSLLQQYSKIDFSAIVILFYSLSLFKANYYLLQDGEVVLPSILLQLTRTVRPYYAIGLPFITPFLRDTYR